EGVEEEVLEDTPKGADEPEGAESAGFVLSDEDEDDAPAQQVTSAGATADPVKDYLKQIGRVPLLNAEQEVELAKRIEAGLFAQEKLAKAPKKMSARMRADLEWIIEDGKRAKNHLVEAINKLARVQRQMLQDLGREPTPEELAKELDMTPEKVVEVQKYGREPVSLSTPLGEDGDSEFGDLIEDSDAVVPADAVSFTL